MSCALVRLLEGGKELVHGVLVAVADPMLDDETAAYAEDPGVVVRNAAPVSQDGESDEIGDVLAAGEGIAELVVLVGIGSHEISPPSEQRFFAVVFAGPPAVAAGMEQDVVGSQRQQSIDVGSLECLPPAAGEVSNVTVGISSRSHDPSIGSG